MKTIKLTERQAWFIRCAIEAKEAVLPLLSNQLSPQQFREDYGISQEEIKAELEDLKRKIPFEL